jgi:hypothetical protein
MINALMSKAQYEAFLRGEEWAVNMFERIAWKLLKDASIAEPYLLDEFGKYLFELFRGETDEEFDLINNHAQNLVARYRAEVKSELVMNKGQMRLI